MEYKDVALGCLADTPSLRDDFVAGTNLVVDDGFYSRMLAPAEERGEYADWRVFEYPEDEPIIEWIYSEEAQRSKNVDQHGPHSRYRPDHTVNRFEHAFGTMLLERIFDRSMNAQVAALLHDTHGPFSHWAEIVLDKDHEYHEEKRGEIIRESDYWDVLSDAKDIDTGKVLEPGRYGSLERARPDLCADRIDYALRDMHFVAGRQYRGDQENYLLSGTEIGLDWNDVREFARSLVLIDGQNDDMFAMPVEPGERFVREFFRLDRKLYFDPVNKLVDVVTADAARELLNDDIVSEDEFWRMTDDDVWDAMQNHSPSKERIDRFEEVLRENQYQGGTLTTSKEDADVTVGFRSSTIDPVFVSRTPRVQDGLGTVISTEAGESMPVEELLDSDNPLIGGHVERASDYPGGSHHIHEQKIVGDTDFYFDLPGWDYDPVEIE